jgi:Glucose / Sorbosone dehydrogenase
VFADLQPVVHGKWDRGLLRMALHPDFPAEPWVYVLYTYDAPPGQTASGRYVRLNVAIPSNNGIRVARIHEVEAYPEG